MSSEILYAASFLTALIAASAATPLCRKIAVKLNILDNPVTEVKTHKTSTPYLGGIAIAAGWLFFFFFYIPFPPL